MSVSLFAAEVGAGDRFEAHLHAALILILILPIAALLTWLFARFAIRLEKRRGDRFAAEIGNCNYVFRPDGFFFGRRLFAIVGECSGIRICFDVYKSGSEKHRLSVLLLEKPLDLAWTEIYSRLDRSRELVEAAEKVDDLDGVVAISYRNFYYDADTIKQIAAAVTAAIHRCNPETETKPEPLSHLGLTPQNDGANET
jgi:hypothetical protein